MPVRHNAAENLRQSWMSIGRTIAVHELPTKRVLEKQIPSSDYLSTYSAEGILTLRPG